MNEVTSVSVRSSPTSAATSRNWDGVGTLTAMILSCFDGGWGSPRDMRAFLMPRTGRANDRTVACRADGDSLIRKYASPPNPVLQAGGVGICPHAFNGRFAIGSTAPIPMES